MASCGLTPTQTRISFFRFGDNKDRQNQELSLRTLLNPVTSYPQDIANLSCEAI